MKQGRKEVWTGQALNAQTQRNPSWQYVSFPAVVNGLNWTMEKSRNVTNWNDNRLIHFYPYMPHYRPWIRLLISIHLGYAAKTEWKRKLIISSARIVLLTTNQPISISMRYQEQKKSSIRPTRTINYPAILLTPAYVTFLAHVIYRIQCWE